ncbi:MAG TPA: cytochrome b/b6 domain-containing protein [Acetobacteraceae bacterium]|nr:cytochrome b/b6 domain-containing protein [Acetobacteraceae bacterium]
MTQLPRPAAPPIRQRRYRMMYRHGLAVRLTHWINFACMVILLMSGLAIFNGWPALYWGIRTQFDRPLLALYAIPGPAGQQVGVTRILGHQFVTTGWLGLSPGIDGKLTVRGFPAWATIPGPLWLAMARRWHFFFAWIFVLNGLAYAAYSLLSRHLWRDLAPSRRQLRQIGRAVLQHARLHFPQGEEARHYNVLQKLSYLVVVFGMGPLMVATGLAMSPWIDAAWPQLLDVFGGRQSARTIHFVTAFAFVAFVLIHVAMVVLSGAWNNMRSMITGRYRIQEPAGSDEPTAGD